MATKFKNIIFKPKVLNHITIKHPITKFIEPTFITKTLKSNN